MLNRNLRWSAEDAYEVKGSSRADDVHGVDLLGEHVARAARERPGAVPAAEPGRRRTVFTIEPALMGPEEKIYVRLEDLIIIGPSRSVARSAALVEPALLTRRCLPPWAETSSR